MKTIVSVFLIFTVMLLGGCGSSKNSDDNSLTGTGWVMFEMDGNKYEPLTGKNITLKFDMSSKKISGNAPCNTYSSGYTKQDNKLSFGQVLSTEMACGEIETEYAYLKLLQKVFAYQISGDKLYLFDSGGMVILRFKGK